jgi:hypothetical protein
VSLCLSRRRLRRPLLKIPQTRPLLLLRLLTPSRCPRHGRSRAAPCSRRRTRTMAKAAASLRWGWTSQQTGMGWVSGPRRPAFHKTIRMPRKYLTIPPPRPCRCNRIEATRAPGWRARWTGEGETTWRTDSTTIRGHGSQAIPRARGARPRRGQTASQVPTSISIAARMVVTRGSRKNRTSRSAATNRATSPSVADSLLGGEPVAFRP